MNIYVGNLAYSVSDNDLRTAFEAYGAVTSANVIKDKMSGESKGFGFVEMSSDEEAKNAIEGLNGKPLNGRAMNVNEARPREDRGGSGGSRGGFGGGSRGGFGGGSRGGSGAGRRF